MAPKARRTAKRTKAKRAEIKYSVSFLLVVKPEGRSGFLRCSVTSQGQRVRFAVGVNRVPASEWDERKQVRIGSSLEAVRTNERLRAVRTIISQAVEEGRDLEELKSMVTGVKPAPKKNGIRVLYERYLAARTDLAPATKKAFGVTLRALQAFEKVSELITLASFYSDSPTASRRARDLVRDLTTWLVEEYGYNDNSTTKVLRHLQTVVRWHVTEGHAGAIPVNVPLGKRSPIEAQEKQALTLEEVQTLWNLVLPEGTNLWHSRNGFVLACYTGQRYSDWHKIDPAKWREPYQIIAQQKTGDTAQILHTPEVRNVLKLYEASGWPACIREVSNSAIVNEQIKEACKLAGIVRKVPNVVRKNGRNIIGPEHTLCDVVTTHTARRTFVTIRQNAGDSRSDIMRRTGHRSEKTMLGYDRTTADQVAARFGISQVEIRSTHLEEQALEQLNNEQEGL